METPVSAISFPCLARVVYTLVLSLLKMIHQALKNGELILNPKDKRKYEGAIQSPVNKSKPMIVLQEEKKGRNEVFFDTEKGKILTVDEFISLIETGLSLGELQSRLGGVRFAR